MEEEEEKKKIIEKKKKRRRINIIIVASHDCKYNCRHVAVPSSTTPAQDSVNKSKTY